MCKTNGSPHAASTMSKESHRLTPNLGHIKTGNERKTSKESMCAIWNKPFVFPLFSPAEATVRVTVYHSRRGKDALVGSQEIKVQDVVVESRPTVFFYLPLSSAELPSSRHLHHSVSSPPALRPSNSQEAESPCPRLVMVLKMWWLGHASSPYLRRVTDLDEAYRHAHATGKSRTRKLNDEGEDRESSEDGDETPNQNANKGSSRVNVDGDATPNRNVNKRNGRFSAALRTFALSACGQERKETKAR